MPATYEPIATTTLGSTSATINFTSISSAYTDLRIVLVGTLNTENSINLRFNGDTATNYSTTRLQGNGTSATTTRYTSQTQLYPGTISATSPAMCEIDIFSYTGSTNKTVLLSNSQDKNGSGLVSRWVGLWRNTAAITSLSLFPDSPSVFATGTTATLYGILKA